MLTVWRTLVCLLILSTILWWFHTGWDIWNKDKILSHKKNINYIPINQFQQWKSVFQFILVKFVWCKCTSVSVNEIMKIIQDECDNSVRLDQVHFSRKNHSWDIYCSDFKLQKPTFCILELNLCIQQIWNLKGGSMTLCQWSTMIFCNRSMIYWMIFQSGEINLRTVDMKNPFLMNEFVMMDLMRWMMDNCFVKQMRNVNILLRMNLI